MPCRILLDSGGALKCAAAQSVVEAVVEHALLTDPTTPLHFDGIDGCVFPKHVSAVVNED